MSGQEWVIQDNAIVEQPRDIRKHPLLAEIYSNHDEKIATLLPPGPTLEIAFGKHMHPRADIGLEAWRANVDSIDSPATLGDARSLPFADGSFDSIIGRRFLHHVPREDRPKILRESARVIQPGGRIILLEGTPGLYRTLTKGAAFRLGLLDEDTDIFGHLSATEVRELVAGEFDVVETKSLGSPVMIASISESDMSRHLFPFYDNTQFVQWWTLIVGELPR